MFKKCKWYFKRECYLEDAEIIFNKIIKKKNPINYNVFKNSRDDIMNRNFGKYLKTILQKKYVTDYDFSLFYNNLISVKKYNILHKNEFNYQSPPYMLYQSFLKNYKFRNIIYE